MGVKCLVLISGGLDSLLAARLMQELCEEVVGICFTSAFFSSEDARRAAETLGIGLLEEDISSQLIQVVKAPRYGYGKNMNPCIDCHLLMISRALDHLEDVGANFLATGEVLGERPMSQNRAALELIARKSGAEDLLLRPLSAKLLPPTLPEREGWIDRESLLDLQGRSRKRQMELAERWGFTSYKSPAGGCLLTDPGFSSRLRILKERIPDYDLDDVFLLRVGRHFWVDQHRVVLGRRDAENARLMEMALKSDHLFKERDYPGPVALVRLFPRESQLDEGLMEEVATLLGRYGKRKAKIPVEEIVRIR
jgi:tRNA U34 2-thiouridine synthase MnmA/TrmU